MKQRAGRKMLTTFVSVIAIVCLLAGATFAFPDRSEVIPNALEKNAWEYRTTEEILKDRSVKATEYEITTLTIEDYKALWEEMLAYDQDKVDAGLLTPDKQDRNADDYRTLYDEVQLGHGFIHKVLRSDGAVHYKYHSKQMHKAFLTRATGDENFIFFKTQAQ